jgi:hypothetical protein
VARLTGTVRRSDDAPAGHTPLTTYLLELTVDFVDASGDVLQRQVETTQLNAAAASPVRTSLVAAWDGVRKNSDAFTLAPQGELTMKGEVHLVRVGALDRHLVSDQLLQTVSFEGKAEVVSPTARCTAAASTPSSTARYFG